MLYRGRRMTSSGRSIVACLLGFSSATAAAYVSHGGATVRPPTPAAQQTTFNRDIAPILFRYCAPCHRPGEAGPFPLLTYSDAKARARQIAAVTSKHFMPPWLPEPQELRFADELHLSNEQISLIQKWAEQGAAEGAPTDLPHTPQFVAGWQLGRPDEII